MGSGPNYHFVPSNPWVAVRWRKRSEIEFPVAEYLGRKGIAFNPAGAKRVHPEKNQVELGDGTMLDYDYLVIATGPKLAFDEIEGLGPEGHTQSVCHVDHARLFDNQAIVDLGEKSAHPVAIIVGSSMEAKFPGYGTQIYCLDCHSGNTVTGFTPDLIPDVAPVSFTSNINSDGYPNHDVSVPNNNVTWGDPPHLSGPSPSHRPLRSGKPRRRTSAPRSSATRRPTRRPRPHRGKASAPASSGMQERTVPRERVERGSRPERGSERSKSRRRAANPKAAPGEPRRCGAAASAMRIRGRPIPSG